MSKAKQAKLLAYSSRLAWAFKVGISTLCSAVLAVVIGDEQAFCAFFLFFSLIGIITDIILSLRRQTVFTASINDADVPTTYELTADELISFAKAMPKVRLFRIIPGILLFPLFLSSSSFSIPLTLFSSVLMIYYPAALADAFWIKKFQIKVPAFFKFSLGRYSSAQRINGSFINMPLDTEREKYMSGQVSAYGYRHSVLSPLNNFSPPSSSTSLTPH